MINDTIRDQLTLNALSEIYISLHLFNLQDDELGFDEIETSKES